MTGKLAGNSPVSSSQSNSDIGRLLANLQPSEISEVLTDVLCTDCQSALRTRLLDFVDQKKTSKPSTIRTHESEEVFWGEEQTSTKSGKDSAHRSQNQSHSSSSALWGNSNGHPLRQKGNSAGSSPASVNSWKHMPGFSTPRTSPAQNGIASASPANVLSEDQKELARVSQVGRKKNFVHYEKVGGKKVNILQGLELHTGVFNAEEQKDIVNYVYKLQDMGQKGRLRERTYTEPTKWMRGKGRVTIQFGCCYNYAVDKDGNPPGIIRDEEVDPLPSQFKDMIKRLVRWHVLPPTCVPNSCIVNIYDEGDCIPPHIDHHDFLRPFCTVSFLTESNILFGSNLKIAGPGEFSGPVSIPLPVGSVLILNGNGADIAKHCVPAVQGKRISVTFRRMDDSKLPFKFSTDPDLLNIRPLSRSLPTHSPLMVPHPIQMINNHSSNTKNGKDSNSFVMAKDDFPPLGS